MNACDCEFRDRQWNPNTGKCENCSRFFLSPTDADEIRCSAGGCKEEALSFNMSPEGFCEKHYVENHSGAFRRLADEVVRLRSEEERDREQLAKALTDYEAFAAGESCAFCGPGFTEEKSARMRAHMETCEKHPGFKAKPLAIERDKPPSWFAKLLGEAITRDAAAQRKVGDLVRIVEVRDGGMEVRFENVSVPASAALADMLGDMARAEIDSGASHDDLDEKRFAEERSRALRKAEARLRALI